MGADADPRSLRGPLPKITTVRLEENVAEKIARLNRTTTARDVYDLVWLWRHYRDDGGLDTELAVASILAADRGLVLRMLADLPGSRLTGAVY